MRAFLARLPRRVDAFAARLSERLEALATRRNGLLLLAAGVVVACIVFYAYPSYPNYDSYFLLLWGHDVASGHLPHYQVFYSPTPHPLAIALTALLSPFGDSADRVLVALSFASLLALMAAVFRMTQLLFGTLVALIAVVLLLTRTDLQLLTFRALVDIPFIALVFSAGALELARPRRGWPVLALLTLAGLLRPEAWPLSAAYVLWLAPAVSRRQLLAYAALAISAPLLWALTDWIVTGDALYSLTSTRRAGKVLHRATGLGQAFRRLPRALGGNEPLVNFVIGGLGALLGVWLLRRRAWLPLALGGIGVAFYFGLALAALPLNARYLAASSVLASVGLAVALAGWTR
ncbi:MAG TPA: hypothetical protein VHE14_08830, partial [Solirubrobacteraceae bacterium]|nr:hypothetical protein [Solirubrobacteraceae bacterium]